MRNRRIATALFLVSLVTTIYLSQELTHLFTSLNVVEKAQGSKVGEAEPVFREHNPATKEERIYGAIFGGVLGDALGRKTEFKNNLYSLKADFPKPESVTLGWYDQNAKVSGKILYTDDSLLAKLLLIRCLERRQNSIESDNELLQKFAADLVEWIGPKDPFYGERAHGPTNIGAAFSVGKAGKWVDSLGDIKEFKPEQIQAIRREGGCGSVMRAWPIGVVFCDKPIAEIKKLARDQSRITHRHPFSQASCEALAVGTALLIQGKTAQEAANGMIQAAEAWDGSIQSVQTSGKVLGSKFNFADADSRKEVRTMLSNNQLMLADMLRYAVAAAKSTDSYYEVLGTTDDRQSNYRSAAGALLGWSADESVAAAVYLLMKFADTPNGFWLGIQQGAWTPGADSDSIASLAGALLGACRGIEIPQDQLPYLKKLEDYSLFCQYAETINSLTDKK